MNINRPLVVLDLETTGTWIEKDKIIEIAMIRCLPGGGRMSYVQRVNPGMPIPAIVTELTGIRDEDVKDALPFNRIADEVLEFIGGSDLAGFNIERFDLPLLERELFETGRPFDWKTRTIYDAQKVYHLNEKRDLTAAYRYYCEKQLENAHSALADAEATLEILCAQAAKYGSGESCIEDLCRFHYKTLADFFDRERKFRWWNGELYPMFGKYAKRMSLQQIARRDPEYLQWMLGRDFSDEIKDLVEEALAGKFPECPSSSSQEIPESGSLTPELTGGEENP